jgi:type IV fimbrial biogenesis protein FimT
MRRIHGFTLIELMIAIGLTGLLLSMAVPALVMFVANARQTGALNDFIASMHVARSAAVTANSRVTVCASADGNACEAVAWDSGWIVFVDTDSDQAVDANETIISTNFAAEGLTISSNEFGATMSYRPNGRVMNAAINGSVGEFTICDRRGDKHAKVLIVDLSGRPRSSRYLIDGSQPSCAS